MNPDLTVNLSPEMPLLAKSPMAAKIFSISERKLFDIRKSYPDFPVVKIGRDIYFDVPRCYEWFSTQREIKLREV